MFPEDVQEYFDSWIDLDTWDSSHPLDAERFYRFVKACRRYGRERVSYPDVKNAIIQKVLSRRPSFSREALEELADQFAQRYSMIMYYEETPFP